MNLGYNELNEDKDCFWDVIIAAVAFVPGWGPVASATLTVVKPSISVLKKQSDLRKIYDELSRVNMTEKAKNYKEDVLDVIANYLKSMNNGYEEAALSEHFIRDNNTELTEEIFKQFGTKCQLSDDKIKKDIKLYIRDIINCLLNVDNIAVLTSNDQIVKDLMEVMREQCKEKNELRTLYEGLKAKVAELQESADSKAEAIIDDNEIFVQKYLATELFLDKGKRKIYLSDVYVSPIIEGNDDNTDLYKQLKEWNKKPQSKTREYTDADAPVLLLYGKAGIGKSSLVAKLISDNFFQDNAHAIILNKRTDLVDSSDPWGSIKRLFGCENDSCYNNKVLILDGFDEVCILKRKGFRGHEFIEKLSSTIPSSISVKILITSRECNGYFRKVEEEKGNIIIRQIEWTEVQLFKWCDNYQRCLKDDAEIEQWIANFKVHFDKLEEDLQDAFFAPIILYICCHENIEVFKMDSIVEVYYQAFHKIVSREYITSDLCAQLSKTDEEMEALLWQYTKEIAFLIFIYSDEPCIANVEILKRAKSLIDFGNSEFDSDILDMLPAVFHFTSGNGDGAIEFAHKTVVEYFIAVKIYEDYFKKIDNQTDVDEVWCNIYEAFAYELIPHDIFNYIFKMINSTNPAIAGNFDKQAFFDKFESGIKQEKLLQCAVNCSGKYFNCISHDTEFPLELQKKLKNERIDEAFRNLTWFLNGIGYVNKSFTLFFKYLKPFLHIENLCLADLYFNHVLYLKIEDTLQHIDFDIIPDKNISNYIENNEMELLKEREDIKIHKEHANIVVPEWNMITVKECAFDNSHLEFVSMAYCKLSYCSFENAHLHGIILSYSKNEGSNFEKADLSSANLEGAVFFDSIFERANLRCAFLKSACLELSDFSDAILTGADFTKANLKNTNFIHADLRGADLRDANLSGARLMAANLNGADLRNANLSGANFRNADLRGADLRDADLTDAIF